MVLDGPPALRAKGQRLEAVSLLIAGYCLGRGLPLLTRNAKHLGWVRGLELLEVGDILKGEG